MFYFSLWKTSCIMILPRDGERNERHLFTEKGGCPHGNGNILWEWCSRWKVFRWCRLGAHCLAQQDIYKINLWLLAYYEMFHFSRWKPSCIMILPRDGERNGRHRLFTEKGGCPHGCGYLMGAMRSLEGFRVLKIIGWPIVWRNKTSIVQN